MARCGHGRIAVVDISCPQCGEADDLTGSRRHDVDEGDVIDIECGACGYGWPRQLAASCPQCGGTDIQTVPLAIVEKSRGTQLSIVGTRPLDLCSQCDAATLAGYHRNRPNPLMPDELPNLP